MTRTRRVVLAAAAAGLVLRLVFALAYWVGQPLTHDEREYLALARSLARGEGYAYPADEPSEGTSARFDRPPGYPAFLALLHIDAPVHSVPARVKVLQAIVGAAGVWMIGLMAWRSSGARGGAAAAWVAAVYPPLVFMPAYALSETLYSTLAVGAALALDQTVEDGRPRGVTAGLLVGASILVRPSMLLVLPLLLIWCLARGRRRSALVVLGAAMLVVVPWTIRNAVVTHRFVPVAAEGGVNFWIGNHPLATGDGDLAANPALKRAEVQFRAAHPGLSAVELDPLYYREAAAYIRREPGSWLALEARKLFYTAVPIGPSYRLHSARYYAASALSYLLLLPCAAAGAWRLKHRPDRPVALWLMAAAAVVAGLIFFPQERYRIPIIDPALIVSAAALAPRDPDECTGRRPDV